MGAKHSRETLMSDFAELLRSPSEAVFQERLGAWTRRLLQKWRSPGLNELEACQLLWVWRRKLVTPSCLRKARLERRFENSGGRHHSLHLAAVLFGKDVRTIRRWCQQGLFPGATLTPGGHWKIPPQAIEAVRKEHPKGVGRRPRRVFGTRLWKEFERDMWRVFGKGALESIEMEAALRDQAQSEFVKSPPTLRIGTLLKLKKIVAAVQSDYLKLRNLARRLYLENPERRIGCKLLADALDIHPSTLYRRYSQKQVAAAVKAAARPLSQRKADMQAQADDAKATDDEKDKATIKEMFNRVVVDRDTPVSDLFQAPLLIWRRK